MFKNKTTTLYKHTLKTSNWFAGFSERLKKNICDAKVIQRKSWLVNDGVLIGKKGKKTLQSGPLRWLYMEFWGDPINGRNSMGNWCYNPYK